MNDDFKQLFFGFVISLVLVIVVFYLLNFAFSHEQIKFFGNVTGILGIVLVVLDAIFHRAAEVPLDLMTGDHVDSYEIIDLEKTCEQRRKFLRNRWYAIIAASIGITLIGAWATFGTLIYAWLFIHFAVALLIWVCFLLLQMAAAWFDLQGFREKMAFRIEETRRLRRDLAAFGNGDQS